MADVKIILPDGSAKEYAAGTTLGEAVKQLSNIHLLASIVFIPLP